MKELEVEGRTFVWRIPQKPVSQKLEVLGPNMQ